MTEDAELLDICDKILREIPWDYGYPEGWVRGPTVMEIRLAEALKSRLREGWVMVPVEPTMGMYDDFRAAEKEERNGFDGFYSGYRAMLSARPKESQ